MILLLALFLAASLYAATAAPFSGGNFITLRTSAASGSPSGAATAVYLDEVTVAGLVAQTVNVRSSRVFALLETQLRETG